MIPLAGLNATGFSRSVKELRTKILPVDEDVIHESKVEKGINLQNKSCGQGLLGVREAVLDSTRVRNEC
jgi:hypothetical protein